MTNGIHEPVGAAQIKIKRYCQQHGVRVVFKSKGQPEIASLYGNAITINTTSLPGLASIAYAAHLYGHYLQLNRRGKEKPFIGVALGGGVSPRRFNEMSFLDHRGNVATELEAHRIGAWLVQFVYPHSKSRLRQYTAFAAGDFGYFMQRLCGRTALPPADRLKLVTQSFLTLPPKAIRPLPVTWHPYGSSKPGGFEVI